MPINLFSPSNRSYWTIRTLAWITAIVLVSSAAIAAEQPKADKSAGQKEKAPLKTGLEAIQPQIEKCKHSEDKAILGATAEFVETISGYQFTARVDTGATTCSIHAEKIRVIEGVEVKKKGSKTMQKNIGRKISFELIDSNGERKRVESTIADTVRVKTSERKERRYKVWLTLRHGDIKRRVHVTLNDRSHMEYPLLIGRNFLCGQFLVDVEQKKTLMPSDQKKAVAGKSDKKTADSEG